MRMITLALLAAALLVVLCGAIYGFPTAEGPPSKPAADALFGQGNFKDAYDVYRTLVADPAADPGVVEDSLGRGLLCLGRLGRPDESDAFLEAALAARKGDVRTATAVASCYLDAVTHQGFVIAGEFSRGRQRRQDGRYVDVGDRDRVRALQILMPAVDLAKAQPDRARAGRFFQTLSRALAWGRIPGAPWRLQSLTAIDDLPDFDESFHPMWGGGGSQNGAPVDAQGGPVYYRTPESLAKAGNDGERWRWALVQSVEADAGLLNTVRMTLADFALSQFGTQTLQAGPQIFHDEDGDGRPEKPGTSLYALETLSDDKTVARLASGIKRFTLPDEFNPIKIYQSILDDPKTGQAQQATDALAGLFENRRQFVRAAGFWKLAKANYGDVNGVYRGRIDQIENPWGRFEPIMTHPAGRGATVDFTFRNGRKVQFEAHRILVDKLLKDVKDYIRSRPPQVDWQRTDVNEVGARLVTLNQAQYQGESVARWDLDLDPAADHFDRRITVTTPLQKAGAYLLTARVEGGNVGRVVVWLDDTALIRKPMSMSSFYFAADARTGAPVAGASLELFGWVMRQVDGGARFQVDVKEGTYQTDPKGQVVAPITPPDPNTGPHQWLATARTPDGRLAYLGFTPIWPLGRDEDRYNEVKVLAVTDRPVYRPGGPVKFKFWVARARYDQPDASEFAGVEFPVEINNPKGERIFAKSFRADAFGGIDGEYELPSDATLGVYSVSVVGHGGGTFRVEEYKKPEFEVKVDAPSKPVALGEKVKATIQADYYFGGPVTQATVKYKITRRNADDRWFPVARWDWLYGSGYWWFASDRPWYPGWNAWGMRAPQPWWWSRPEGPPEVVADAEVPIGPDGKVEIEIDTAFAKAAHPDRDHKYEVEAQVTDQSRRTIVGTGDVLVSRKPFTVYAWVDRGHYRAGDTIQAEIRAQTLDRKPVVGEGTLKLLKVTYEADGKPVETPVESWPLKLDADGRTAQTIKAAEPGQYRVSARVDDGQGHAIEGGYLLTVAGQGFNGASYRFDDLEIIPDKKEYRAGEKIRLLVNTDRADSTVLLFLRPTNGVYAAPSTFRMRGKTETVEVGVAVGDMPNLFIEALTVSNGKVHDQAREIAVPPESRVVNVEVAPSQATYKPVEKAKLALKLTGPDGKPFVGSTVLTVYDKAVEYISGGSNVEAIKDVFWKWKRSHNPQTESSLARNFYNLLKENETPMLDLGTFGGGPAPRVMFGRGRMGGGMMGGMAMLGAAPAAPMAMAAPAPAGAPMEAGMAVMELRMEKAKGDDSRMAFDAAPAGDEAGPAPVVRTNFADTAYWSAAIETKADGSAELEFPLPDSLTTWKARTWTMGPGTRVGQAEAEFVTTKDLLVRLQAPRFFVQKDEVVLSAVVHSKLKEAKSVQVALELDGSVLEPLTETSKTIELAAGGEARVDWRVKVAHEGQAVVRMKAIADSDSDAAQMTFPAFVHGMLKMEAIAGSIRPDQTDATVTIKVPAERRPEQTRLEVRYSPTLAGALVDALPYLADYPYGCTEQTLNRFLPSVITQKTIIDLGVDLKAIQAAHTNLNAQELGPNRPRLQGDHRVKKNPIFELDEIARMSRAGLDRLAEMQLSDGGWGWFSGYGEHSYPHTTAQVVHGLQIARRNDLALPPGMLERGVAWLTNHQAEQVNLLKNGLTETKPYKKAADDLDALVFMILGDADVQTPGMIEFLERDRPGLSVYGKCLYGLALHKIGDADKLAKVLQNVSQYVVEDEENQTAWLKLPNEGSWWNWYGSETETDAFYLKLLARTDPKGRLASRLVKYILNNREHGSYWRSTRDTAYNVEALAEYLKASGEDKPNLSVAIAVDGKVRKEVTITPANLFSFDASLVLEGAELDSGEHAITFTKKGSGPLYFNTYLTNFTLEDPIAHAGLEVKVDRKVYRLIRDDKAVDVAGGRGQAVSQRVEKYRREPLADGATLKSGELVEVELEIESKNDYEYLVFEDFKAAGFEPVEVRSGYNGNDMGAYVEFRDERVAFFVPTLSRGKHGVAYRLRAEIPGKFHALPARGEAMYAPELKGNSDEIRLEVVD
ncbi:MG2 domain-containing protein [Paludisphaera mucosa]|uniref:MG2 domain-containing protein n=1 Tax=Paludisphaera mucosa TaxID=3030827 RepID=A0ABT6F556_9BACT|nr:MG2 domain-containing protein [Paludisphaera mucosa]MDG3002715.1 MG2 domain-containing protein [Paludisphaera mucosa]